MQAARAASTLPAPSCPPQLFGSPGSAPGLTPRTASALKPSIACLRSPLKPVATGRAVVRGPAALIRLTLAITLSFIPGPSDLVSCGGVTRWARKEKEPRTTRLPCEAEAGVRSLNGGGQDSGEGERGAPHRLLP